MTTAKKRVFKGSNPEGHAASVWLDGVGVYSVRLHVGEYVITELGALSYDDAMHAALEHLHHENGGNND